MLGEHNITYRPRISVKGQILADLLVEKPDDAPPDILVIETLQELWTLLMDKSSCVDGSGAGLILKSPEGTEFIYALRFQFTASNNEAEYAALIVGLRIAAQMGVCNVHVSVDSKLVANQVLGTYVAKEENMVKYLEKTKSLVSGFANFFISQVPRSKNKKADALRKIASTSFAHLSKQVLVEVHKEKSIQEEEVTTVSNGLVERANRSLGEGIKARLGEGNKKWIEKLLHVLWAHRTMIKSSNGDTPFSLTYGTEAVIPIEIRMPMVRGVTFRPEDFVYHSTEASHAMDGGKLNPKWEGPYEVTEALGDGASRLSLWMGLSFCGRGTLPISRNIISEQ
uniref:Reverse transcriptase domain-containing protein n=1 Tax=Tanacetum cinerariifolium TaxID=118510 RepID=A0A699HI27_TANCI|nr:reverse transcriptase domain-containing protein [Tanacetum cinerariifolium]